MSVIVTDSGFGADRFDGETVTPASLADHPGNAALALDLPQDTDVTALAADLDRIALIRVAFPAFNDGRGFTVARRLRLAGFTGTLRAKGHVIADQYTMARRAGFDEVEITDDLAARQPADQWRFRSDWQSHDYQARLRARVVVQATSLAAE